MTIGRALASTLTAAAVTAGLLTGCSSTVGGEAVSPLYDPFRVGGLPAVDGPSGLRADAPDPVGVVLHTDGGDIDRLALLAVNDVADFWSQHYADALPGDFEPVERLVSYDSNDPSSPRVCGGRTYKLVNAFFCPPLDLMAWDRGVMVPVGQKFFGDMSVVALIAHEYGHAVQRMAGLLEEDTSPLVIEQQADCFAGAHQRWVVEGNSPRFTLDTGDGLNHVLAAALTIRDPLVPEIVAEMLDVAEHGNALDRISAFQLGFINGAQTCAAIDEAEVAQRRGDLPRNLEMSADGKVESVDVTLDESVLAALMDDLDTIFDLPHPPTLSLDPDDCGSPQPGAPVAYCPDDNTVGVDLPALQEFATPASEYRNLVLLQGDNTAISALTSRYVLAVQRERGVSLDTAEAALRTACLTGFAQQAMAERVPGRQLVLSAGDVDEAVAGLLVNGIAASNVTGATVPAGFTRIVAYRSGLLGDLELCYSRFG
ncbi:neutral zinc metallopeptidase [[Mycobacterium] wendilense]|uniref:Neutral zinc metallopeptidase n=1 Tax=[Mycobacterium] wendilense TaxID=3064284 RepID=A0ABM9MH27_9MYCO|nr:neutral zinc metallopeptidase [Mycolicibacterium sp. MU0050]CAJ1585046.1 neutral zinc metallopeptidase [Mycolicibacterium sp. MU0050]